MDHTLADPPWRIPPEKWPLPPGFVLHGLPHSPVERLYPQYSKGSDGYWYMHKAPQVAASLGLQPVPRGSHSIPPDVASLVGYK